MRHKFCKPGGSIRSLSSGFCVFPRCAGDFEPRIQWWRVRLLWMALRPDNTSHCLFSMTEAGQWCSVLSWLPLLRGGLGCESGGEQERSAAPRLPLPLPHTHTHIHKSPAPCLSCKENLQDTHTPPRQHPPFPLITPVQVQYLPSSQPISSNGFMEPQSITCDWNMQQLIDFEMSICLQKLEPQSDLWAEMRQRTNDCWLLRFYTSCSEHVEKLLPVSPPSTMTAEHDTGRCHFFLNPYPHISFYLVIISKNHLLHSIQLPDRDTKGFILLYFITVEFPLNHPLLHSTPAYGS